MSFIPDSGWGIAYLTALIVFGFITWRGPNLQARRILLVMAIHWFFIRTIDWYDKDNFVLWLAHDYVFYFALLLYGKSLAARACSGLFLLMIAFDSYSLAAGGGFEGASAVAEGIGYLIMLIMAGSAHGGTDGKLAGPSRALRSGVGSVLHLAKVWWPLKRNA